VRGERDLAAFANLLATDKFSKGKRSKVIFFKGESARGRERHGQAFKRESEYL
jgi:hypothetical protein